MSVKVHLRAWTKISDYDKIMVFRNSESSMFFMRMILFSDEKRVCVKVYLHRHRKEAE